MDEFCHARICEINEAFDAEREEVERAYRSCRISKWQMEMSMEAIADHEQSEIDRILEDA